MTTPSPALQFAYAGLQEAEMRRKGGQVGSLRQAGGNWHIEFRQYEADERGNLIYRTVSRIVGPCGGPGGLSRRAAAKEGFERYVGPANQSSAVPSSKTTVRRFIVERFQLDHVDKLPKKASRVHYRTQFDNHVLPTIGDMELGAVTPRLVQMIVNAKAEAGYSKSSVRHVVTAISAVFKHATVMGFFHGPMPTLGVKIPPAPKAERRALTDLQAKLLIAEMPERYRPLVVFLIHTGVRINEALGLRWANVNLSKRAVGGLRAHSMLISKGWVLGEETERPKTPSGYRIVPLTPYLVDLLGGLALGKWYAPDRPVFAGRFGQPLNAHNISNRALKVAGKRAGVPWVSFHVLRHTNATIMDGELTGAQRQKVLGHSSERQGLSYTHPELEDVREKLRKAMEVIQ